MTHVAECQLLTSGVGGLYHVTGEVLGAGVRLGGEAVSTASVDGESQQQQQADECGDEW